ncbi:hypothetical protein Pla100_00960 [Neorhodopirellula pilleata]|uniref:Uncharacterized protein n=1 Tax=Neorhodopirellula pilleata TaxID=2714738 RepID=A0A5C6AUB6_9BACT|nr:hypothetical protein Pla100_00960 [Neorhodopirellula pilleata]
MESVDNGTIHRTRRFRLESCNACLHNTRDIPLADENPDGRFPTFASKFLVHFWSVDALEYLFRRIKIEAA